jgi:hypothetical protein
MATIHYLANREQNTANRSSGGTDPAVTRTAEIVLFTGVRYERWIEPTATPTANDDDRAPRAHDGQQRIEA